MPKASGVVEIVAPKGKAINAKIGGVWYGCGFVSSVPFVAGDNISFDYTERGDYKNLDPKTVQKQAPSAAQAPAPAARPAYNQPANDERQRAITFQASRNAAIETAALAQAAGVLNLGAQKNKQLDNLFGFIDDLTRRYYLETEDAAKNGVQDIAAGEDVQQAGFDAE